MFLFKVFIKIFASAQLILRSPFGAKWWTITVGMIQLLTKWLLSNKGEYANISIIWFIVSHIVFISAPRRLSSGILRHCRRDAALAAAAFLVLTRSGCSSYPKLIWNFNRQKINERHGRLFFLQITDTILLTNLPVSQLQKVNGARILSHQNKELWNSNSDPADFLFNNVWT